MDLLRLPSRPRLKDKPNTVSPFFFYIFIQEMEKVIQTCDIRFIRRDPQSIELLLRDFYLFIGYLYIYIYIYIYIYH
jgi:hypothetical protein